MTGFPAGWFSSRRIAAAVVLGLTLWLIRYFVIPLIWAAVFAIANWPLYHRCAKYVPEPLSARVLPLIFSTVITFLVLGPIVFAFAILARQSQVWLTELALLDKGGMLAPSWLRGIPVLGTRLGDAWNDAAGMPGGLSALLGRFEATSPLRSLESVGHLIAYHSFVVAITVVALVFFFSRGEELAKAFAHRIDEQFGRLGEKLVGVAVAALRATLQSMVLVGVIDGIAMGVIYTALHIPSPVQWGAVTGILATLPFIGYAAVVAVCVAQLAHDTTASALLVGAVGFAVLFFSDKFVRPFLMVKGAKLNFLGALMGTVGGLQTFGLLGIFIGPTIVAVGKAMLDEWLTYVTPVAPDNAVSGRH